MCVPSLEHYLSVSDQPPVILDQDLEDPEDLRSKVKVDPVSKYSRIREVDPERSKRDFSYNTSHDASPGTFLES
jgi:hypothetical protein